MDIDAIRIDPLSDPLFTDKQVTIACLRLDLLHPMVSGNKWFKLRHNIQQAKQEGKETILTFGGAYSNHLHATAHYCQQEGLTSIGIVRGAELYADSNPTLRACAAVGMELIFIDRTSYRAKDQDPFVADLIRKRAAYVVPEGGDNALGIKGAAEIQTHIPSSWNHVMVSIGSGTTIKGLLQAAPAHQQIWGFTSFSNATALQSAVQAFDPRQQLQWVDAFGFGGFGRQSPLLTTFINDFYLLHQLPLDTIYTGKMMYGLRDMILKNVFKPGDRILFIHTGGLQGNVGNKDLNF